MPILLKAVNLSAAVVGTTGTIDFRNQTTGIYLAPTAMQRNTGQKAHLRVYNESGCGLDIDIPPGPSSAFIPAGGWLTLALNDDVQLITYTVSYVIPGAPVTLLKMIYYQTGESLDNVAMLGNSPIGVGGTIVTSAAFPQRVATNTVTVTTTSAVSVVSYTVPSGPSPVLLRASLGGFMGNGTSPRTVAANVAYSQNVPGVVGLPTAFTMPFSMDASIASSANVGKAMDGANTFVMGAGFPFSCAELIFQAAAGTTVTIQFQDAAGTPNYLLEAVIEQLA